MLFEASVFQLSEEKNDPDCFSATIDIIPIFQEMNKEFEGGLEGELGVSSKAMCL